MQSHRGAQKNTYFVKHIFETDSWKVFFRLFKPQPSPIINHYIYHAPEAFHLNVNHCFSYSWFELKKFFLFLFVFINSVEKIICVSAQYITPLQTLFQFGDLYFTLQQVWHTMQEKATK